MTTIAKATPRFKRTPRSSPKKAKTTGPASVAGAAPVRTASPAREAVAAAVSVARPRSLPEPAVILPKDFFLVDSLDLAPRLLGKFLRRDDVVLQITEVEAYRPNDSACHGRFGITSRTAPVVKHINGNSNTTYYQIGNAISQRISRLFSGLETIQDRRGQKTEKPVLLTGPGKVGQALGLSTAWSNHPLFQPGGLEVLDGPEPEKILVGPRVGIDYALPEHVNALWRFAIAGSPWISAPKSTLRPP